MIIDFQTRERYGEDLLEQEILDELREMEALNAYEGYVSLADEELSGYHIVTDQ